MGFFQQLLGKKSDDAQSNRQQSARVRAMNPTQKADYQKMIEKVGIQGSFPPAATIKRLMAYVAQDHGINLKASEISLDASFESLGFDLLMVVELGLGIEDYFDREVSYPGDDVYEEMILPLTIREYMAGVGPFIGVPNVGQPRSQTEGRAWG